MGDVRMKRKWKFAVVLLSTALLAAACAKADSEEEPVNKPEKKQEEEMAHQRRLEMLEPLAYSNVNGLSLEPGTYISIIGKSEGGEFWKAVKQGAERAAKDINDMLGYEGQDKVKVTYNGADASDDVDDQVNILDEELARYPLALGIAIIDSKSCDVQFDLATENDIPIIAFDSVSNYQGIMAKVGTDNAAAAREAAGKMAEELINPGEVMLFIHDSKSVTSKERGEVFAQELKDQYPGVSIGNTYYLDNLEELKKTMVQEKNAANPGNEKSVEDLTEEEIFDYIFQQNPNVKGIYATDGDAVMKAVDACDRLQKEDITVIGFDADTAELAALEKGKVAGLIAQNPYGMGYATVVAAGRSILELGNEADIDSGYMWVNKENMEEDTVKYVLY